MKDEELILELGLAFVEAVDAAGGDEDEDKAGKVAPLAVSAGDPGGISSFAGAACARPIDGEYYI